MLCTVVLSCVGFAPQEAIHCCKTWFLLHISHIYIYMCVGVSQNEVSFFPRKATLLEPKKDTSCWDIPRWVCVCVHIYIYVCKTYIFLTCVFFLSCVSLSHPKNIVFFLHVVWQPHRIRKKLYQTKTCSIESYNIEIKHEEK